MFAFSMAHGIMFYLREKRNGIMVSSWSLKSLASGQHMVLAVLQCFCRGGECLPVQCFFAVNIRHIAWEQGFFFLFWHQVGGITFTAVLDGMCYSRSSPNNDSTFVSTLCNLKILLDPDYIRYISQLKLRDCNKPLFACFLRHCLGVFSKKSICLTFKLSNVFHPLPISWIPTEKRNKTYSALYISLTIPLPVPFVSAHDCSFVFFIVRSGGRADEKGSLHDPMAVHSPWQPCAQSECAGSACSNDLISVLPRRSRWEHRCADCPLSHGTAGPTHAILH